MTDETDNKEFVDNVIPLFGGEVKEAEHPEGIVMDEWVFTNDKHNPAVRQLFHMLYTSVFRNKLGVMHARVEGTDTVHTLIVGVEETEEGVITWPIAKILTDSEQLKYETPDGTGNFLS